MPDEPTAKAVVGEVTEGADAPESPEIPGVISGLSEDQVAAADAMVERNYLETPKQQAAIARARERALAMYRDYRDDAWFRAEASVRLSVTINFFYSFYQMFQAARFDSIWFAALGLYSIMVTTTRVIILRYMRPDAEDGREELERYRSCGYLMLMLTFAVGLLALVVNLAGEHPIYPGSMIYVVAGFTFYTVYTSLANLITYRKLESPLISASKSVAMSCALVSLFSLQAAVLALYCVGDLVWLRTRLNLISAILICAIILTFAFHIIIRASRALAGKEDLSLVAAAAIITMGKDNREEFKHYSEDAQRQLEYWQHKEGKVEWRTQGGAMQRHDEEIRERFKKRAERRAARKKK